MPHCISFGAALKRLLKQHGVKSAELSAGINVDPSLVWRWLRGERVPSIQSVHFGNICDVLQLKKKDRLLLKHAQYFSLEQSFANSPEGTWAKAWPSQADTAVASLLEIITGPAVLLDRTGIVIGANEVAASRAGCPLHQLLGCYLLEFFPASTQELHFCQFTKALESGNGVVYKASTGAKTYLYSVHPIKNPLGKATSFLGISADITLLETPHAEPAIKTDILNCLYTQPVFMETLRTEMARSQYHETPLSLAMLEIDQLIEIFKDCGHRIEYTLRCQVAEILFAGLRRSDIVGCYNSNKFMVILPNTEQYDAHHLMEILRCSFESKTLCVKGHPLTLSAGVAHCFSQTASDFTLQALNCLYAAKRNGGNHVVGYPIIAPTKDTKEIKKGR